MRIDCPLQRLFNGNLHDTQQSIPTEYMTKAPEPGRRGKRTGMGMDDVGRLLAGRRAEQSRRCVGGLISVDFWFVFSFFFAVR